MDLSAELRRLLPRDAVIADPVSLSVYECDALSAYRQRPKVVVLPRTGDEVRAILRLCHRLRVPVVARGAGTGLSGGALPHAEGVLLSLTRLNRILHIDPVNRTATVEPGVRNTEISEAAAPHGLYYAPDPSSQIACTIGGNVAENSGGVHCLKYGLTLNNLLALTVMTIEGECLELGGQILDVPGYDLLALMTGSEGLLGIVTSVTVKLIPQPQAAQVVLAAFGRVEDAGNGVAAVIAAGIIPAGLEMMDRLAIEAAENFVHAGYPLDAAAILLCEIDGHPAEIEAELLRVAEVLKAQGATEVRVARDENERRRFWTGRKAAFPAVGRIAPDYYCMDGTIPRRQLAAVLARINALSREFGLAVANVFHAGDGNLHPLILYDANVPGQLERAEAFGGKILEVCVEAGGTITGEHGVGVEKLNQMCVQFTGEELAQFHAVKSAFDPDGLLNPGKAIPTLRRCAEFGALHVHAGKLPFPELERF
ncbi:MAG: FAD-linked oxidase C-terminal domain-containing protein [Gammaproteobacteria bacterium]